MEKKLMNGTSSRLYQIYRIVIFSFFLNVVCTMVLIWKLLIVSPMSYRDWETDRKSTRLNSSHSAKSRMPSSA